MTLALKSEIQVAQAEDLPRLLEVLHAANQHALDKSGKLMWVTDFGPKLLPERIARGQCYVLRNSDRLIVATITINDEDSYTWGSPGNDGSALYFHGLMRDPHNSLPNTGRRLVRFVAEEAVRRNKPYVRCDTKTTMPSLIKYYESLGLTKQRTTIYKHSGFEAVLLQAEAQEVLARTTQA